MRWYSPRDWIEGEEEEEERREGGDCPLPDSSRTAASFSPPQQTSSSSQTEESKNTKEVRDEESLQGASDETGGGTEMETGEAATKSGDAGDAGDGGEGGDGGDNEGWGEEDWDMINDDEEDKSRQKDSPSQDVSVTEPPAIKVKIVLVQYSSSKGATHDEILKF